MIRWHATVPWQFYPQISRISFPFSLRGAVEDDYPPPSPRPAIWARCVLEGNTVSQKSSSSSLTSPCPLANLQSPRLQKYLALRIHYQFLTGGPTSSWVTPGHGPACFGFLTAHSSLGRLKMLSLLIAGFGFSSSFGNRSNRNKGRAGDINMPFSSLAYYHSLKARWLKRNVHCLMDSAKGCDLN